VTQYTMHIFVTSIEMFNLIEKNNE